MSKNVFSKRSLGWVGVAAGGAAVALAPHGASAHFTLDEPASWRSQDSFGNPQKLGPCGDDGTAAPTGEVTAFQTGQTITITIRETIFHPGHYRVALALNDRSELPPEPTVTPATSPPSPCGTVPIMDPPVFPVLADGVLVHTSPLSGPQTFDVTLPAGMTCTHCTLQIIEFMSQHPLNNPGGCFYHHCADISIQDVVVSPDAGMSIDDAGTTSDAGATGTDGGSTIGRDSGATGNDAGSTTPPPQACACSVPGEQRAANGAGLGLVALGLVGAWRRRTKR